MQTGFFTDTDGKVYYLNPVSNNTMGAMMSGWQFIDSFWYYFNRENEGTYGSMVRNGITNDGYRVDENGHYMESAH